MLITHCICGSGRLAPVDVPIDGGAELLPIARCGCGVEHLRTKLTALEVDLYYAGQYHEDDERHVGVIPYKERYGNDRRVAALRLAAYQTELVEWWAKPLRILDVGAANGAFVDECRAQGHDAYGVEPDPSFCRDHVECGGVLDLDGGEASFDLITYHDVLEHVVDPRNELEDAKIMLRSSGVIVVDVPDVAVAAGRKHYKREHLWYFTTRSFSMLAKGLNMTVRAQAFPIPGKMVTYLCART